MDSDQIDDNTGGDVPFKATTYWNRAVDHLVTSLSAAKGQLKGGRTVHSGRTVTDVLMAFAMENRQNVTCSNLTRDKVVKLSQVMLDCRVISTASGSEKNFRDSHADFYVVSLQVDSATGFPKSPMQHFSSRLVSRIDSFGRNGGRQQMSMKLKPERLKFHDFISPFNRLKLQPNSKSEDEAGETTGSKQLHLSLPDGLKKKFGNFARTSPSKLAALKGLELIVNAIPSPCGDQEELDWLPFEELLDDSLIHDLALFRLLTLIDLPVLDNIVHVPILDRAMPRGVKQIFPSLSGWKKRAGWSKQRNGSTDGPADSLSMEMFDDSWLAAASMCANLSEKDAHDDLLMLSPLERRRVAFSKVTETHLAMPGPLIPHNYNDICKQIFLLKQQPQKLSVAIEATQLLMQLLTRESRLHLRNLLSFMDLISRDTVTRVCDELSNMDAVLNSFGSSILHWSESELSRAHYLGLLEFLVVRWEEIFLIPPGFRDEVKCRLERQQYTNAVPLPSVSYCSRVSATDFSRVAKLTSDAELINLVNTVVDDTKLSRQYKESFLDSFKREHPDLYRAKFPDLKCNKKQKILNCPMGSVFGKAITSTMEAQHQFMLESQRLQLERQLQMQNLMRERQMAMQIAIARERLAWLGGFSAIFAAGAAANYSKTKNPNLMVPLLPLLFLLGYQWDYAFGDKISRCRKMADSILVDQADLVAMPVGIPTFEEIEMRRHDSSADEISRPNQVFL